MILLKLAEAGKRYPPKFRIVRARTTRLNERRPDKQAALYAVFVLAMLKILYLSFFIIKE